MATTPQNIFVCPLTLLKPSALTINLQSLPISMHNQCCILMLLLMGIENLCSSICIRYSLDLTSLRLLDMLYIRGEMFAAVCLFWEAAEDEFARGKKDKQNTNTHGLHISKTLAADNWSIFCLWDELHVCLFHRWGMTGMQSFPSQKISQMKFRKWYLALTLVNTNGILCCKDMILSLSRVSKENT